MLRNETIFVAVLGLVAIIALIVALVQTSQSHIDSRIQHFLNNDQKTAAAVKRIVDTSKNTTASIQLVQVACPTDTLLTALPIPFIMDQIEVPDQAIVLLLFQKTSTDNGIYRFDKSAATLTKEVVQPAIGSLLHVAQGTTFSDHMFIRTNSGYISLAQALLVNKYNTIQNGVLTYDPSQPLGVLFTATPNAGHPIVRISENTVQTIDDEDSNSVFILESGSEARLNPPRDGSIVYFISDGAAVVKTVNSTIGASYTTMTTATDNAVLIMVHDDAENQWRVLVNTSFTAS